MSEVQHRDAAEVREWLVARIAAKVGIEPSGIPTDQPMSRLGVDSTEAVVISGELQEWLGRRVAPTIVWDHPTIDELAAHLAAR